MNTFKTITSHSESLYKEKGSKFLGIAIPVQTTENILSALAQIKQAHPKATHHCYAYKIGKTNPEVRANDDGEPSNSAGKPILGQIERNDVTDILIIVVRYYGGTKLGVGGLQTAYKTTAALAIEANTIVEKAIPTFLTIRFPFDKQGVVDHLISLVHGEITDKSFTQQIRYICSIPKSEANYFVGQLQSEHTIEIIQES